MRLKSLVPMPLRHLGRRATRFLRRDVDELVLDLELEKYRPPAALATVSVEVREVSDPLADIAQIDPALTATARCFLERNYRAVICRSNGVPAGYLWLHDRNVSEPHPPLDRFEVRLEDGDVYLFNFYVAPAHRKGGVAGAFFAAALSQLRKQGYRRALGFVVGRNIPARWMYTAHGWRTRLRFTGRIYGNALLMSDRGLFVSTALLGLFNRSSRRVVTEFLPLRPVQPDMDVSMEQGGTAS